MEILLTAVRNGDTVNIFADVHDIKNKTPLTAKKIEFVPCELYETDTPEKTLLSISISEAKKLAEQIINL